MFGCFDIGGTSIKYGVFERTGEGSRLLYSEETPTNAKVIHGHGIQEKVFSMIEQMRSQYELHGVGISTAGQVDVKSGKIQYANKNIPGYTGMKWSEPILERFGLPCAVENDVKAAALGEYAYGAGRNCSDLLCITVGTGIGGALIIGGKIHHGYTNSAGEIGYMLIDGDILESKASTTALLARIKKRSEQPLLDGKELFERAKRGDSICREEIEAMCDSLALGIVNCCYIINPERIILGGGIMAQSDYLRPIIERYISKYADPFLYEKIKIDFAQLGNHAGLYGAAYLIENNLPLSLR